MLKAKLGAITQNTLIPMSLAFIIFGAAIWVGGLATKVDAMIDKDSPSRNEYNQLCSQLDKIQNGVDSINKTLINYNSLSKSSFK